MWNKGMEELLRLLVLAAGLRATYEASRPQRHRAEAALSGPVLTPDTTCPGKLTYLGYYVNLKATPKVELPPQVEKWKRKELRGFKEAQEKKWRRWTEAMYEPGS